MYDLILFNADVRTLDAAAPGAELVAIQGGRIQLVGRNEILGRLRGPETAVIDCGKRTLLPGFIDAHCHVRAYAESLVSLNLSPRHGIHSISDIQSRIRDCSRNQPSGTWIRGKSYNEFYLEEGRHPNRWDLDAAAPRHPVKLTHRSGHAHVLNSLALEQTGISVETGDPPEGLIDRDPESGAPTGILYGLSAYLAGKIPQLDKCEIDRGLALANEKLLSFGITSVQDVSAANDVLRWKWFEEAKTKGILRPRLTMTMGWRAFAELQFKEFRYPDDATGLRLGGVKLVISHVTGNLHPSQEELNEQVSAIHKAGLQAIIHAVEESEIEAACNAVAYALNKHPRQNHRHRIEHCSVCPPPLQRRLASLGIMAVTQPSFIYYSGDRYLKTVRGEQLEHLYPIGSMLHHGIQIGSGSDFPVSEPNAMVSIYAAVTRMAENGEKVVPRQGIPVLDAVKMHTTLSAYAGFEEGIKGSICRGKLADMVLLSEDPFSVDAGHLKDIKVAITILNGRVVWENPAVP